jgi:hypothetical protein
MYVFYLDTVYVLYYSGTLIPSETRYGFPPTSNIQGSNILFIILIHVQFVCNPCWLQRRRMGGSICELTSTEHQLENGWKQQTIRTSGESLFEKENKD